MFNRYTYPFYILDEIKDETFAKDYDRGLKKSGTSKNRTKFLKIVFRISKKYLLFEIQIRCLLRNKFLKLLYVTNSFYLCV